MIKYNSYFKMKEIIKEREREREGGEEYITLLINYSCHFLWRTEILICYSSRNKFKYNLVIINGL